jgi:hypothetical protein
MRGALRLTGLPAPERCPVALLGPEADPEAEELRLLARLREMGYEVRRAGCSG